MAAVSGPSTTSVGGSSAIIATLTVSAVMINAGVQFTISCATLIFCAWVQPVVEVTDKISIAKNIGRATAQRRSLDSDFMVFFSISVVPVGGLDFRWRWVGRWIHSRSCLQRGGLRGGLNVWERRLCKVRAQGNQGTGTARLSELNQPRARHIEGQRRDDYQRNSAASRANYRCKQSVKPFLNCAHNYRPFKQDVLMK